MRNLNIKLAIRLAAVAGMNAHAAMVLIPAGSFSMGDPFAEGHANERPVHSVTISAFYMDEREVTKAEWDAVYTWAITNGYTFDNAGLGKGTNHPVHTVSWYDCVKWANARSEQKGRVPCYTHVDGTTVYKTGLVDVVCNWSANGYRLPTEAEWEKAARGGAAGQRFSWSGYNNIAHSRANYYAKDYIITGYDDDEGARFHPDYDEGGYPFTSPAGSFAANGYGLYDTTGNLFEWCWDWNDNNYYASSPSTNPRGPATGLSKTWRGGYWFSQAYYCRVARRLHSLPVYAHFDVGFRLVSSAP